MHKEKPELNLFLAQTAIEAVYNKKGHKKLEELRNSCQSFLDDFYGECESQLVFKKFWAQVMKRQVTLLLTEAVINSL